MKICHITHDMPSRASYRYRVFLPGAVLEMQGHEVGVALEPEPDAVNIWHKHGKIIDPEAIAHHLSIVDVTDDHFDSERGSQYREAISAAKLVTCSSRGLVPRIKAETGRHAIYIADPYEFEEAPFVWQNIRSVLWYGHGSNFFTLRDQPLDCLLEVVTQCRAGGDGVKVRFTPWSLPAMLQAFARHDTVIVPRGADDKQRAKGNNRLVNALRRGKFVVASDIPSHRELESVVHISDSMLAGIQWGRENPGEVATMVERGQKYVSTRYSPERIAAHWLEVCKHVESAEAVA